MALEADLEDFAPIKVACFGWLVIHEACLTQENLRKRGFKLYSRCYLCENSCEFVDHLFMDCNYTWQIWTIFMEIYGVQCTILGNLRSLLGCRKSIYAGKFQKKIWLTIPLCIAWTIWTERNRRCSEGNKEQLQVVKYRCILNMYYWKSEILFLHFQDMLDLLDFIWI